LGRAAKRYYFSNSPEFCIGIHTRSSLSAERSNPLDRCRYPAALAGVGAALKLEHRSNPTSAP
jgi:hypothetical protein